MLLLLRKQQYTTYCTFSKARLAPFFLRLPRRTATQMTRWTHNTEVLKMCQSQEPCMCRQPSAWSPQAGCCILCCLHVLVKAKSSMFTKIWPDTGVGDKQLWQDTGGGKEGNDPWANFLPGRATVPPERTRPEVPWLHTGVRSPLHPSPEKGKPERTPRTRPKPRTPRTRAPGEDSAGGRSRRFQRS